MAKYCPDKRGPALYPECGECDEKNCEKFFCLVVGSRGFDDYDLMKHKLDLILSKYSTNAVIVSGGAKGADSLAEKYAKEKGYELYVFPADWSKGKSAGYARNRQMHEFIAHFPHRGCVAFWDGQSKGTQHNFELAKEFDTQIRIVEYTKERDD